MSSLPKVELTFIDLNKDRLKFLRPVKVLDIKDTSGEGFHEDGLFSTAIFGRVGTKERDQTFSYIPIHTKVFHPLYYKQLIRLKSLYGDILTGKTYAVFDKKEKDFVKSDAINGDTGYAFFIKHFNDIEFKRNGSRQRDQRIDFILKYKNRCFYSEILVMPAGLRDIEEKTDGKSTEGEINEFYRRIIGSANSLSSQKDNTDAISNTSRVSIQNSFNQIYEYITGIVKDKKGFIQGKWAKRTVATGSRSVITSISTANPELGSDLALGFNQTAVGIYQACKSYEPLVINAVLQFVNPIFGMTSSMLIDKNTMQLTKAIISTEEVDKWTTPSGIRKTINNFETVTFRTKPVTVGQDYYMALIWLGEVDGVKVFKIVRDIRDLPEGFSRDNLRPLTYVELFYLVRLDDWAKDIYHNTRYPITGDGSIYPSLCYIRTTVDSDQRFELDDAWQVNKDRVANAWPVIENANFIDSLSVHPARLAGLGGDHDGDKTSSLSVLTDSARQEVYDFLDSTRAYVGGDKRMIASVYTEPVTRVLLNITTEMPE